MDGMPALRDVRCFAVVAEHRSFSRAARTLRLSQPAVSQAIGRLERAVGHRLFERSSRDVRLSAVGRTLLPRAEALLAEAAAFAEAAGRATAATRPTITLAYPTLLGTFAARLARRMAGRDTGVEVVLRAAGQRAAAEAVAAGEVGAAILAAPVPAGLAGVPLFTVAIDRLAVPAADPLGGHRTVRLGALTGRRVLVPGERPPGGPWPALVAALPTGTAWSVGPDPDDLAALDLVAAGNAVLPLPSLLADTVRRPDVRFVPLADPPPPLRFRLASRPDAPDPALLALVQAVHHLLRTR
ncbi:LysR family transcriptional regulator [Actinocatenispora rupis]|uniref:Transcriptional regulator n=2 Tax=Actinocatenispora rupis TaxID=519421 RepID=A0A8J3J0B2_9ACTN|nr:transcriptional regulator [Actinocatenispora rupis]